MLEINRKHLLAAMRRGKHFNAIDYVKASRWQRIAGSSDEWLKPFLPPFQRSLIEYASGTGAGNEELSNFEKHADIARARLPKRESAPQTGMGQPRANGEPHRELVVIKRSELEAAIAEAVAELAVGSDSGLPDRQRGNLRHGLQMYGVHVQKDKDGGESSLRLANADLPFSLRFIACSFEMPISLSSARMVTLDLSGCAVPGIDATFLKLSGSLRLRRLYSSAPLDFTGAQIHGFFDGADMVLQPFGEHPPSQAVSPERAMLGLNQVQIDNEIRLQRAQIWGGLTMRGLEANRSIYMSDAAVLAPLAVLEALAKAAQKTKPEHAANAWVYRSPGKGPNGRPEPDMKRWRKGTWLRGWSTELSGGLAAFDAYRQWEEQGSMGRPPQAWSSMTLPALLTSNLRARTSAIRADGIKVAGSLFFEKLMTHGRVRAKYAQIDGSLTLTGARLRSTEALMPTFDRLAYASSSMARRIGTYREKTYLPLVDPEDALDTGKVARGADIYALDLRETRIAGDVRIGIVDDKVRKGEAWATRIDGKVAFDQARFDGTVRLEGVMFRWSQRLGESVNSEAAYQSRMRAQRKDRSRGLKRGEEHQISARGLITSDTVNLCSCRSLKGADFSNAAVGGDLVFFKDSKHPGTGTTKELTKLVLIEPAVRLCSAAIDLSGANIVGDLRLLFDPAKGHGPRIDAERVTVGGLLSIMRLTDNGEINVDAKSHSTVLDTIRQDKLDQRRWAALPDQEMSENWRIWRKSQPVIDLTNASATILEFPSVAWPRAGRLRISGFTYQRALRQGPLGPHPISSDTFLSEKAEGREFIWKSISAAFFLAATVNFFLYVLYDERKLTFFNSFFFLSALFLSASIYIFLPWTISPKSLHIVPMANHWLSLQPSGVNPYRTSRSLGDWAWRLFGSISGWIKPNVGNLFRSLEPYTIAADALRREGRWISANLVEQERFRVRNWQLSWRTHFLQKSGFQLADVLTEYGYNYARVMFLSALTVVLAAMTVEKAQQCGAIMPKDYRVQGWTVSTHRQPDKVPCPNPRKENELRTKGLDVAMFALDTVLPIMDLGETADWEIDKETTALSDHWPKFLRDVLSYARLLAFYHTIGLFLAGVLLLGLSTRFGQWLSRYGD